LIGEAKAAAIAAEIVSFGGDLNAYVALKNAELLNDNAQIIFTEDGLIPMLQMTNQDGSTQQFPIPVQPLVQQQLEVETTQEPVSQ
jgi:hypothetical protein